MSVLTNWVWQSLFQHKKDVNSNWGSFENMILLIAPSSVRWCKTLFQFYAEFWFILLPSTLQNWLILTIRWYLILFLLFGSVTALIFFKDGEREGWKVWFFPKPPLDPPPRYDLFSRKDKKTVTHVWAFKYTNQFRF